MNSCKNMHVTCLVFMLCMLISAVEVSVELDTYGTEDFEACNNNMHLSICKAGSVGIFTSKCMEKTLSLFYEALMVV